MIITIKRPDLFHLIFIYLRSDGQLLVKAFNKKIKEMLVYVSNKVNSNFNFYLNLTFNFSFYLFINLLFLSVRFCRYNNCEKVFQKRTVWFLRGRPSLDQKLIDPTVV